MPLRASFDDSPYLTLAGKEGKRGIREQQTHTTVYKIGKKQGPTVQYRELYAIFYNNIYGKRI